MTAGFVTIEIPASKAIVDLAKIACMLRCRLRITDHGTVRLEPETKEAGGYQPRPPHGDYSDPKPPRAE